MSWGAAPLPLPGAAEGMGPAIAVKLLASDLLHLLLPVLVPGFIAWLFNTAVRSSVTGEVAAVPACAPSLCAQGLFSSAVRHCSSRSCATGGSSVDDVAPR